ncbi:MAG: hypothetical protein IJY81_05470 [Lachnospiraceae bacterium]|nr:hypothetical protein [Lachnospiraceae bacterium]
MKLILPLFILILFLINHNIKRSNKITKDRSDAFWENENKANNTRKMPIDDLEYITIPLESLPILDEALINADIVHFQKTITELSTKQILNLTGISNTELKLSYGAANLPFLSDCDANYTKLVSTLARWGEALLELDKIDEATTVLEYGIECGTDVTKNYTLLAKLYNEQGADYKIAHLIAVASNIKSASKDSIIKNLRTFHTEQ